MPQKFNDLPDTQDAFCFGCPIQIDLIWFDWLIDRLLDWLDRKEWILFDKIWINNNKNNKNQGKNKHYAHSHNDDVNTRQKSKQERWEWNESFE